MHLSNEKAITAALVLYFITITVGLAATTLESRVFIEYLRIASATLTVFLSALVATKSGRLKLKLVVAFLMYLVLLSHGLLLSIVYDAFHHISGPLLENILLAVTLIFLLSNLSRAGLGPKFATHFVLFAAGVLLLTVALKGLLLGFPPKFIYDYYTSTVGSAYDQIYSQGISKFYGLSAVLSAYLSTHARQKRSRALLISLTVIFLSLTLLGGGRGESIAALAVAGYLLARRSMAFFLATFGIVAAWVTYIVTGSGDDTVAFAQRFMRLASNDYGLRDVLFSQAISLLSDNGSCLILGCGFGYFQEYYGYPSNFYPHNVVLEMLIALGMPATLLFSIAGGVGIYLHMRRVTEHPDLILIIFLFFLVIYMKSDTILSAWVFLAFTCVFAAETLTVYFFRAGNVRDVSTVRDQRWTLDGPGVPK